MGADLWEAARGLAALFSVVVSVIALVIARRDKSGETQRKVAERMELISTRLTSLEESVRNAPSHNDITALHNTISLVGQRVAKLEGLIEANTRTTERMNQFLMESTK